MTPLNRLPPVFRKTSVGFCGENFFQPEPGLFPLPIVEQVQEFFAPPELLAIEMIELQAVVDLDELPRLYLRPAAGKHIVHRPQLRGIVDTCTHLTGEMQKDAAQRMGSIKIEKECGSAEQTGPVLPQKFWYGSCQGQNGNTQNSRNKFKQKQTKSPDFY